MYKKSKKNFEGYFLFSLWTDFCQKIKRFFYISLKIMKMIEKENNRIFKNKTSF